MTAAITYGVQPTGLSNISRWIRQRKAAGLATPEYMLTSAYRAQLEADADKADERAARATANELAQSNLALGYASLDAQKEAAEAKAQGSMVSGLGQMATMGLMLDKDTIKNSFIGDFIWGGEEAAPAIAKDSITASFTGDLTTNATASLSPTSIVPGNSVGAAPAVGSSTGGGAQAAIGSSGSKASTAITSTASKSVTEAVSSAPATAEVGFNSATMGVVGAAGVGSMVGGFLGSQLGGKTGNVVGSVAGGALGGFIMGSQVGSIGGPAGAVIGGVVGGLSSLLGGGK